MPWKDSSVFRQRCELVEAMMAGVEPVTVICRRWGVSRTIAYRVLARFRADGRRGLRDRSHAPKRAFARQAPRWRKPVLELRRAYPSWGARKLRWWLRQHFSRQRGPAERTVQRWLKQSGCVRQPRARRRKLRASRRLSPAIARRSNDVWTIDLKGWFRSRDGAKIEPLTVRDAWSHCLLWTKSLAPKNDANLRRICGELFRHNGKPRVMRCDRGTPFFGDGPCGFTRLSLWWWRLGIRVEFVRRGSINNNAHEQMHGVMKNELVIADTARAQARALQRWTKCYNCERPNEAIGLRTPASVYHARPGPLPRLYPPSYPRGWLARVVQENGTITLRGWHGSIGRAFGGLPVGLAPAGHRSYRVHFGSLYLGRLYLDGNRKLVLPAF